MRILLLLIFLLSSSTNISAQYSNPNVQWSYSTKKIAPDQFDLVVTAKVGAGYHLYSQFIVIPEGGTGPISTSFAFIKSKNYSLVGKVKESGNRKEAVEPLFDDITLIWFEEEAIFTQRVKLKAPDVTVKGVVSFMTCNDRSCDPPSDQEFEFKLTGTPVIDTVKALSPDPVESLQTASSSTDS
ncbi:MAG: hypothetical protein ABIO46_11230, partial [Chitinophagales bacterium]